MRKLVGAFLLILTLSSAAVSISAQTPLPQLGGPRAEGSNIPALPANRTDDIAIIDTAWKSLEASTIASSTELSDAKFGTLLDGGSSSATLLPVVKKDSAVKVNIFTGMGHAEGSSYAPLSKSERWQFFLNQALLPPAYFGIAWSTAIDQLDGNPKEWGKGAAGLGKRIASRFTANAIGSAMLTVGTAVTGEDPRYIRSRDKGFFKRAGHALVYTVMTYNRDGKPTPAFAAIGAQYGASLISQTWMPGVENKLRTGLSDGTLQFAFSGMFNVIEEFWPEMTQMFSHTLRMPLRLSSSRTEASK